MEDREKKELAAKKLKYYLREYWVQPSKDALLRRTAESFVSESGSQKSLGILAHSDKELKQIGQQFILAYNRSVFWDSIDAYSLVEKYIQGEPVQSEHAEPEFLIILYGVTNIPNKMIVPLTNGLISYRASLGKKTLVISLKATTDLVVPITAYNNKPKNLKSSEII